MVHTMNEIRLFLQWRIQIQKLCQNMAKAAGAAVVGTGRSDFPNQVNNVLAFPGIFRGALDVRATQINEKMKVAAVMRLHNLIRE